MSEPLLPALRPDLELMPSADPARPGLVLRDPFHYSGLVIWLPVPLAAALTCFDGGHSLDDLAAVIPPEVEMPGPPDAPPHVRFADLLRRGGLLLGSEYERLREQRHRAFHETPVREAAHAGGAYPESPEELRAMIDGWAQPARDAEPAELPDGDTSEPVRGGLVEPGPGLGDLGPLVGVAAPHVSPHGAPHEYGRAFAVVAGAGPDRTYVVLGTSHYGEPGAFGLTRKPFRTPLGETRTAPALVDRLATAAPDAVIMEDYCHSIEHSIEFQVVFLQRVIGPDVRILPILCGSLHGAASDGEPRRSAPAVESFLAELGRLASEQSDRLFWVLGIDLAHVGARYGDRFEARAGRGPMQDVERRDRSRLDRVCVGDLDGFQALVTGEGGDDLRWCGHAPLYTFLRAVGGAYPDLGGRVLGYRQWNIDPRSVVSFAALAFGRGGAPGAPSA